MSLHREQAIDTMSQIKHLEYILGGKKNHFKHERCNRIYILERYSACCTCLINNVLHLRHMYDKNLELISMV